MEISAIYQKLYEFVVAATGYASDKVIFANQSTPRPSKPFIMIDVQSLRNVGKPIVKLVDEEGVQETTVSMLFTASFQAFSDLLHEAEDVLSTLHIKFSTELQNDIFQGELAALKTLRNVSAIPEELNEQIESRAILDMEMSFNKATKHEVGLIEEVHFLNEINNKQYVIKKGE